MRCCINCFNAKEPQSIIEDLNQIGNCDFCQSKGVATIEPIDLRELFEPVLKYYEPIEYGKHYLNHDDDPMDHGDQLGMLLQQDWNIFSELIESSDQCNLLIDVISGSTIDAHDLWCTVHDRWYIEPDQDRSTWYRLTSHLKNERRFFLDLNGKGIDGLIERIEGILENIEHDLPMGSRLYRARLGGQYRLGDIRPFTKKEMGSPPPDPRRQGRGNPSGISYIYAASDEKTAIAEKRPGRKSLLSLAELIAVRNLRLIDLAHLRPLESPFGIDDLAYEIQARRLLRVLSGELSKPVSPEDHPDEYLPSQFLCELILSRGYDGVIYVSGYGPGQNYLLFDTKSARARKVKLVEVTDTNVILEFGKVYNLWEERLE